MSTSEARTSSGGNGRNGNGLRRVHRWLGIVLAAFILLLSLTGIALNHSSDWKLDRRYVAADWLLNAYGVRAPKVSASFADNQHRVTLLGQRLYLDQLEIAEGIDELSGMVSLQGLVVIVTGDQVLLFTGDGELVERMNLPAEIAGPVERAGRAGGRVVITSAGRYYLGDANVSGFELWPGAHDEEIDWSTTSVVPDDLLTSLRSQYRGRGLSVERLLTDIHSGRIVAFTGPYLMDAVAILLIVLCITGVVMWTRPRRK